MAIRASMPRPSRRMAVAARTMIVTVPLQDVPPP
jgi:hypothetical protein